MSKRAESICRALHVRRRIGREVDDIDATSGADESQVVLLLALRLSHDINFVVFLTLLEVSFSERGRDR